MRCPYCGKDNPAEARFCRACGKELAVPAPFSDDDPVPGADRKKRRGGRIALIVLAALTLVAGIVFRQAVAEFFARTFQSPEAYYQHVEARAIDRFASVVGDRYAAAFGADGTGAARATTLRLEPVIPGMDWLEQITLTGQSQRIGGVSGTGTALEVNGVELLTAEVYADAETTALRIPLLSDAALALSSDADLQAFAAAVGNAGLTRSEVEGLTRAVLTAAANQLHQVERSREPLTAEGISQRCAKLTLTITEADADAIRSISDLANRDIVAQSGSLQEALAAEHITAYREFRRLRTINLVYLAVADSRADAAIVDYASGQDFTQDNPDLGLMLLPNVRFYLEAQYEGDRVAAKKGEYQLMYFVNGVIDELLESGEYMKWYEESAS